MTSLFSGPPKIPDPIVPAPAPQKSDAEVISDANATRQRLALAGGRARQILVGADSSPAPTASKILLGAN